MMDALSDAMLVSVVLWNLSEYSSYAGRNH